MVKDPLQVEETPYEILKIDHDANTAAVHQAFKTFIAQRGNVQKGMAAQNILLDPLKRAMLDILYYDHDLVDSIKPSPVAQPDVLLRNSRAATTREWERSLFGDFPNLALIHSLGVLWYWWAIYEDERFRRLVDSADKHSVIPKGSITRQKLITSIREAEGNSCQPAEWRECQNLDCPWREDCTTEAPDLQKMWQNAISYWVMLLNMEEFWNGPAQRHAKIADNLKAEFIKNLKIKLDRAEEQYRKKNTMQFISVYSDLQLTLTTEIRTAELMTRVGISLKRNSAKLCCGSLLLQHLNLVNAVQVQVDKAIESSQPGKWKDLLVGLRSSLSPYSYIAQLLHDNKPDAALEAIAKLPLKERRLEEIINLRSRALLARGQQQASLNNIDEALTAWSEVLKISKDAGTKAKAKEGIVNSVKERAAYLGQHSREAAISLIEKALKIVKDQGLEMTLGEMITTQAINRVNKAQDKIKGSSVTREIISELELGLTELKRAVGLGCSRASQQIETVERIIAAVKASLIPASARNLINQAGKEAGQKNWDKAIELFNRVRKEIKGELPSEVAKIMAICYGNRGMRTIDQVWNGGMQKKMDKWVKKIGKEFSRTSSYGKCARCKHDQFKYRYDTWYNVELPKVGKVLVCGKCADKARKMVGDRPQADRKAKTMLDNALYDLREAFSLDKGNANIQKQINDLTVLRSQLGVK